MKRSITTILILIACSIICSRTVFAEERVVQEIEILGEDAIHADKIERIIPISIGAELSMVSLAQTSSILKKTGLYESIEISYEYLPDDGGIKVVIKLAPLRFVKTLKFRGAFPIFETELRNVVRTREGVAYRPETIDKDIKRLEVFLQKEGYFESEVDSEITLDHKTGDVVVTYIMRKGIKYNLRKIKSTGNKNLHNADISLRVRFAMPLRYRKEKINKAIESIVEEYHRRGFYEVRVKIHSIELDPALNTVTVNLDIYEGPRAKVSVKGNFFITNRRIFREFTFGEQKSVDEYEIAATADKIIALYKSRGFLNVDVGWEVIEKTNKQGEIFKEIVYRINEGTRVKVRRVEFEGAASFEKKKLRKQMITGRRGALGRSSLLVEKVLEEDLLAIETFYRLWGYEEAKVLAGEVELLNDKGSKVNVIVEIEEGPQTIVRKLSFDGVEFFLRPRLVGQLNLVEGAPFNPALLASDKRKLLILYANYGYPYAKVSQRTERYLDDHGNKSISIFYTVREGKRVEIGETVIRGNYRTKGRVLTREIELNSGEVFSYSELLKSRRNLRTLPFLYSANMETLGLEENMDIVHILLNVRERPVRTLDFGVGYDSDLGPNAWIELGTLNLLGLGKTGKLKFMGGGDINRAELLYSDPRFMGSRLRADTNAVWTYEKHPAYDLTQLSGSFSLTRRFRRNITGTVAQRTAWSKLADVSINDIDDISVDENTIIGAGPIVYYDTRDDFINPSRGWFNRLMIEYVQEFNNSDQFVKIDGQVSRFIALSSRTTLAASTTIGHIETLNDSNVPLQEVFFVGGNRSVRGYSEDGLGPHLDDGTPIGGLNKLVTSVELRFPLFGFVNGVLFCDSGQLVYDPSEMESGNQRFTVGTGLRLMTPVGPVRLDWGYKLEPVWWERRDRWHFSFGFPF